LIHRLVILLTDGFCYCWSLWWDWT